MSMKWIIEKARSRSPIFKNSIVASYESILNRQFKDNGILHDMIRDTKPGKTKENLEWNLAQTEKNIARYSKLIDEAYKEITAYLDEAEQTVFMLQVAEGSI